MCLLIIHFVPVYCFPKYRMLYFVWNSLHFTFYDKMEQIETLW
jgi:hypothetical protein